MGAWILAVRVDWDEMSEYCESEGYVVQALWERNVEVFSSNWEREILVLYEKGNIKMNKDG